METIITSSALAYNRLPEGEPASFQGASERIEQRNADGIRNDGVDQRCRKLHGKLDLDHLPRRTDQRHFDPGVGKVHDAVGKRPRDGSRNHPRKLFRRAVAAPGNQPAEKRHGEFRNECDRGTGGPPAQQVEQAGADACREPSGNRAEQQSREDTEHIGKADHGVIRPAHGDFNVEKIRCGEDACRHQADCGQVDRWV